MTMKVKLTPALCYAAGLQSRNRGERSTVGIATTVPEMEERFVELCVKELKIEPNKILIQEREGVKHIFFYHSKLARQLRKIRDDSARIFRLPTNEARSYVAGLFDASGHVTKTGVEISGMSPREAVVLAQLGVQTTGNRIRNIRDFVKVISGFSTLVVKIKFSNA